MRKGRCSFFSFVQFSSTCAKSCVAIFCHNLGAPALPRRRHRLNEKLLSARSNIAWPSNPATSRRKAEIIHPWVPWLSFCFLRRASVLLHRTPSGCPRLPKRWLGALHCHASAWKSFPPAIPSVCGNFSSSQVLYRDEEERKTRTTSTSLMSTQRLCSF